MDGLGGRRRGDRRAIHDLRRSIALIVDGEALAANVAARLHELFDPEWLAILVHDPGEGVLAPLLVRGVEADGAPMQLDPTGPLAAWIRTNEGLLVLPEHQAVLRSLAPEEATWLKARGVRAVAPLLTRNRLLGVLVLGAHNPRWRLPAWRRPLLIQVAEQVALAFHNAVLYRAQGERLEQLHRAERLAAVGQLAAGVAHEIRNPLTAIRSTLQYLQKTDAAGPEAAVGRSEDRALMADLLEEVDRINGTISALLGMTRSGPFQPHRLDAATVLEGAVRLVEAQARQQTVEVVRRYTADQYFVHGDGGQLRQVLLNLLLNALQAMPEGGRLTVEARVGSPGPGSLEEETPVVELRVRDTGVGIPAARLRTVFDPLFTTKREGTGLGLSICHGIVERHGGAMFLESREGSGTVVTVRLPRLPRGEDDGEDSDR